MYPTVLPAMIPLRECPIGSLKAVFYRRGLFGYLLRSLDYRHYLSLLDAMIGRREEGVLVVDHPPVITVGTQFDPSTGNPALWKEREVSGVEIHRIRRGGMATVHEEGQLVFYPVIDLRSREIPIGDYFYLLLGVAHRFVQGIVLKQNAREIVKDSRLFGIFYKGRKVVSIGIGKQKGFSIHGLAINLFNNKKLMGRVVLCGDRTIIPITLAEIGLDPLLSFEGYAQRLFDCFVETLFSLPPKG